MLQTKTISITAEILSLILLKIVMTAPDVALKALHT